MLLSFFHVFSACVNFLGFFFSFGTKSWGSWECVEKRRRRMKAQNQTWKISARTNHNLQRSIYPILSCRKGTLKGHHLSSSQKNVSPGKWIFRYRSEVTSVVSLEIQTPIITIAKTKENANVILIDLLRKWLSPMSRFACSAWKWQENKGGQSLGRAFETLYRKPLKARLEWFYVQNSDWRMIDSLGIALMHFWCLHFYAIAYY